MQSIGSLHSTGGEEYEYEYEHEHGSSTTNGNKNANANANRDLQQHHNSNSNNNSSSSNNNGGPGSLEGESNSISGSISISSRSSSHLGTPFFADMTLDISVAHDIAETPEAVTRKTYNPSRSNTYTPGGSLSDVPHMPPLPEFQHEQMKMKMQRTRAGGTTTARQQEKQQLQQHQLQLQLQQHQPQLQQSSSLSQRAEGSFAQMQMQMQAQRQSHRQTQSSTYNSRNDNDDDDDNDMRNDTHIHIHQQHRQQQQQQHQHQHQQQQQQHQHQQQNISQEQSQTHRLSSPKYNHDFHNMDDDNDDDSDNDNDNHVMARVTSNNTPGGRFRPFGNRNGNWRTRLRRKQWPKDISWAVAFWMIVPIGLFAPLVRYGGSSNNNSNTGSSLETSWLAAATSPRSATLHTLTWGLIAAAVLLPRLLYRTSGGVGPGDDARHFASQLLLASAPVSACVYLGLLAGTYLMLPDAFFPYGLIPLWYLARDLYLFRRWKMTATTPGGRQAFFQALACAALDILSRSLKRKVFYRAVVLVILGQFGVIALWRLSLLAALRSGSLVWAAGAFLGGKWATGTVARLLTLTACGGVSNWFAEQSSLIEGMHQMMEGQGRQDGKRDYVEDNGNGRDNGKDDDNDNDNNQETTIEFSSLSPRDQKGQSDGYGNGNRTVSANANGKRLYRSDDSGRNRTEDNNNMPEAYRMADASQYRSTVGTGMDGDFESDDDESLRDEDSDDEDDYASFLNDSARRTTNHLLAQRRRHRRQERHQRKERRDARSSTVRQLMASGLSVSFGSVTKCGLLGGLAQLVWSQIRKIDHARATLGGMRGMPIGGGSSSSSSSSLSNSQVIMKRINSVARNFVRAHSDMAMSYVADYQMSYTRAAQEVAILVDEAGVEPIIHDDISTHMSACVGGSVSGVIILFTGAILVHQRNRNDPGVPDSAVALDMVIAFFFCYTLIFTVMEPLRASIKAVYVCFAQHPEALSQAYPLIFHRLSRMSQSNLR